MANENESIYFDYVDLNGSIKKAEVLTLFSVDGNPKSYAICSVPSDDGNFDIMSFIVNETIPGVVSFDDIVDTNEFNIVSNAVNKLLSR